MRRDDFKILGRVLLKYGDIDIEVPEMVKMDYFIISVTTNTTTTTTKI
jgi:hypothetical protein